jgi:hypothetical protein
MRNLSNPSRKLAALAAALLVAALGVAAVSLAAGGAASSKAKIKIKCPPKLKSGKKVSCKVLGKLPRGPKGAKGARGAQGQKGDPGAAGAPGVSAYEVVSQTFKEVFIINSGGQRGLSDLKTVSCPSGKRVLSGGFDLGTNATQNGQQRQVLVSLSGPNGDGSGWSVQLFNNSTSVDTSIDLRVYAVCATTG